MRELALHLLDIAENSISAQASNITIQVREDRTADRLFMAVIDDGKGMDPEMVARVIDPFVTSRTTRKVGLGIPLLKAAAEACNGGLTIASAPGVGTTIEVEFQLSHIDRMPLGSLAETFLSLLIGSPHVHWVFDVQVDEDSFVFDDQPIKQELDGVPLTEPDVLRFIREYLEEGLRQVHINQA